VAYGAVIIEEFTGGMGTAAFLAFLMSICDKRYAASQYALLSAGFGLGRTMVGFVSGEMAEGLGYAAYFLRTLLFAFPAFLLLHWVRKIKTVPLTPEERAAVS
jgi:PAT family beta-lactamase induction signal transducer AmpG